MTAPSAPTSTAAGLPGAIEGLGIFYLGRRIAAAAPSEPLLVDSRRFTTHAVCVGMTGSGKTGLLVSLLEEAALDGIPALVIDPKGDLANLLLAFPDLAPADFLPWVEADAAAREGITVDELAARTARLWSEGLAASGQSPDRIRRLRAAVEMAVYTPGSRAGRPLAMLGSMEPPEPGVEADPELRRERIESLVSGVLALAGIGGDPGTSREHVLLAAIVDALWKRGERVDFGGLVRALPAPPLDRVGFLDLENFYSAADRFQLATRLNTVAAAPGFDAWLTGDPLDPERLLRTPTGRPRVAVVSIAHLPDAQRMAVVTLLATATNAWMRLQGGTSALKALFLMDEVFGYLPPTANPPSKTPLLTLLKQARAFGVGVVLATQNPVDLDYKGLSNAGLWFLGRLQTARDKDRVLDGLEGAAAGAGGSFDRQRLDRLLAGLSQRQFLLHSIYGDEETLFQTRWTMAYLRGPLLREEIRRLSAAFPPETPAAVAGSTVEHPPAAGLARPPGNDGPRPLLPPGVKEVFLAPGSPFDPARPLPYEPCVLARVTVRYGLRGPRITFDREFVRIAPAGDSLGEAAWDAGVELAAMPVLEPAPRAGMFASLPGPLTGPRGYQALERSLKQWIGRHACLTVWRAVAIDEVSRPGESEADFRGRISQRVRERRDAELEKLAVRQAARLAALDERLGRARQKLEREQAEAQSQSFQSYVSIGSAVLDALLGRRRLSTRAVGRAASSARAASRAARQRTDVVHAEESLAVLEEKRGALEEEIEAEIARVRLEFHPDRTTLEPLEIPALKTGIGAPEVVLAWVPGGMNGIGIPRSAGGPGAARGTGPGTDGGAGGGE